MLNAAIYGLGRWGNRLVESVQGSSKFRFVKGISREPEKHKEFSQKTGVKVVSSYGRILKDPEIDAVVLATPHSLHVKQIVQAAKAGKHVFVEKPFTLTRKTAEKAVEACKAAGVTLGVGFNRRYSPVVRRDDEPHPRRADRRRAARRGHALRPHRLRPEGRQLALDPRRGAGRRHDGARGPYPRCHDRHRGPRDERVRAERQAQAPGRHRHRRHDLDAAQVRGRRHRAPQHRFRDRGPLQRARVRLQGLAGSCAATRSS